VNLLLRVGLLSLLSASPVWAQAGDLVAPPEMRYLAPAPVEGLPSASSVATGTSTSCAIAGGEVWCWGEKAIFGDGVDRDRPQKLRGLRGVTQLSVGDDGGCTLDDKGQVWCWGHGFGGPVPRKRFAGARKVSVGAHFACASTREGRVACWGNHSDGPIAKRGQTPAEQPLDSARPQLVPELDHVVDLAAGERHACAARTEGDVVCWAVTAVTRSGERFRVPELGDALSVSTAGQEACALRRGNQVSCWSNETEDRRLVGLDACGAVETKTVLFSDHDWGAVLSSGELARVRNGRCTHGKRGAALAEVRELSSHCLLRKDGAVVCWGANSHGELGRPATR